MKIKAIIFTHNQLSTAEELFRQLKDVFDTAFFDSGSDENQVSPLATHKFPNLYWTGCWTKAWALFPDYDVIWGIGGDCTLKFKAENYLKAIESAYPFGLWSPAVSGFSHEYMQPTFAGGRIFSVCFLEGIAFAMGKELWESASPMDSEDYIGYANDRRLSVLSRRLNLKNILDARVEVDHPLSKSYDRKNACRLMEEGLERAFGAEWADVIDWWPDRHTSFIGNACSQIMLSDGKRKLWPPFHRK